MKYIDADRLKAEIEKRMHICDGIFERDSDTFYQGKAVAYGELLPFIDSLPDDIDWGNEIQNPSPIPSPKLQKIIDKELFRMKAAKDILCAMLPSTLSKGINPEETIDAVINLADGLISKLKDNE